MVHGSILTSSGESRVGKGGAVIDELQVRLNNSWQKGQWNKNRHWGIGITPVMHRGYASRWKYYRLKSRNGFLQMYLLL